MRQHLLKAIFAFLIFFLASIYITWPLIFHLGNLVTEYGDELVIAWIQNWVIHEALHGNFFLLWHANIYYPFHNSFAYSDQLLTTSLLSLVPLLIIKQPIIVVNFTLISSLFLLGTSMYFLSYYLTKDFFASLLSGMLVLFSPAVLDKAAHLQTLAIEWVPLAFLFYLMFINSQKTRYLLLSLLCFLLQTYNSFVPGYFIAFSYIIITMYFFFFEKDKVKKIISLKHIAPAIASLFLIIPIAIPYFQVSQEYQYVRDIRDTIHFALQPEDFLNAGGNSRLQTLLSHIPIIKHTSVYGEIKPGFIGLVFSILALLTIGVFIKYFKRENTYLNIFTILGLFGLVLCLGPFLHINRVTIHKPFPIPLPYVLFYYLVPGFKGIRDTERWEMLFVISIAVAIAIAMKQFLKQVTFKKRFVIYVVLFFGIVAEYNFPLQFHSVPQISDFPKVYAWLETTPKNTKVIFLPIYNWNHFPYTVEEMWRQYYSTIEWRDMVNGYSGFSPPAWQKLVENQYNNFPKGNSISQIKTLGIHYIIVDKNAYDLLYKDKKKKITGSQIITEVKHNPTLRLIKKLDNDYIIGFR